MFDFFIDTADIKYIENKWDLISKHVSVSNFLGITTNPNAFARENLLKIEEWKARTEDLASLTAKIKGDDSGIIHVQMPSDSMTSEQVLRWAEKVSKWGNGKAQITLKIPPYKRYLELASQITTEYGMAVNVTGIADAVTALTCVTRPVEYISIIPGRMEEVGIDAKAHVLAVMNANVGSWKVITGSMRTLEGLAWCVDMGTIPTIGKRVLDLITEDNTIQVFQQIPTTLTNDCDFNYSPYPSSSSEKLSRDFFIQMNELGQKTYEDFIKDE